MVNWGTIFFWSVTNRSWMIKGNRWNS
jgi:hypothetical protein